MTNEYGEWVYRFKEGDRVYYHDGTLMIVLGNFGRLSESYYLTPDGFVPNPDSIDPYQGIEFSSEEDLYEEWELE